MGIRTYKNDKEKDLKESMEAREIVSEIMNFGVSQKQILYIMHDLAMELENANHIRRIRNLLQEITDEGLVISKSAPKKSPLEI